MALFSSSANHHSHQVFYGTNANTTFSTTKFTWNNPTARVVAPASSTGTFTLNPDGSTTWELDPMSSDGISEHDGYLVCGCTQIDLDNYVPCRHVHDHIRNMKDAITTAEPRVMVPLFADPIDGRHLTAPIMVDWKDTNKAGMASFWLFGEDSLYRLGWLSEGEGRKAIRFVTLEWLRYMYPKVLPCKATTHHSYFLSDEEREKLDLDSSAQTVIAGIASRLIYGECWRCHVASSDDTLVPDP